MTRAAAGAKLVEALRQGIALHNEGRLDEADRIYRRVLQQAPRNPDALHLRALIGIATEKFAEAAKLADLAIAQAPRVANFHNTAGEAYRRSGRLDAARLRLTEALRLDPSMKWTHHNLSLVAMAEGRAADAEELNRKALAIDPDYAEAMMHGIDIAFARASEQEATSLAERLRRMPRTRETSLALARFHTRLARARAAEFQFEEAARHVAEARASDPQFWGAWLAGGETASGRRDCADAELQFAMAANLAPENPDARLGMAIFLEREKRLDEAESHYLALLADNPESPAARFGVGTVRLMRGDYETGWEYYEARKNLAGYLPTRPELPVWQGEAVGCLLLSAEQGLGDTVQMLRFVPAAAKAAGGHVVLKVQPPVLRLATRLFSGAAVSVTADEPEGGFDAACPLMSLPLALGVTNVDRVQAASRYVSPPQARGEYFSRRLGAVPGRKLGLVWRGAIHSDTNRLRGIDEAALSPLLEIPGWAPVSLQFGLAKPVLHGKALIDLSDAISDFEDLAAAMTAVDAVISLDSGPAHLAGALGVEVFTLVPWIHDWRWGVDGAKCDWYSSMRLYRQTSDGDWGHAIARLVAELQGLADPGPRPAAPDIGRIVVSNRFPLIEVEARHGRFSLPLLDAYITRSMLAYGEYSPREAEVLVQYLRPGDGVIDVGANLGTLTLPMARAVGPSGSVLAFEPQTAIHDCLCTSLRLSGCSWVDARRQAVGAVAGAARIARGDLGHGANFGGVALNSGRDGDEIAVIRLDDLNLAACRLIKIDVEGMELSVLKGAAALIAGCRPVLYVECDRPGLADALVAWLRQMDYRVFWHRPPLFSQRNFRNRSLDLFPGIVSGNLLALPPGELPPPDCAAA